MIERERRWRESPPLIESLERSGETLRHFGEILLASFQRAGVVERLKGGCRLESRRIDPSLGDATGRLISKN